MLSSGEKKESVHITRLSTENGGNCPSATCVESNGIRVGFGNPILFNGLPYVINSSSFSSESVPLDRKTRRYIEGAIVVYLKVKREATSEEILCDLLKQGYRVALDLRQVAEICSSMKRRGAFSSCSRKRITFWRIDSDFYKNHPNESMFGEYAPISMSLKEYEKDRKRRTKRRLKARK
jgi:hypothetical protein